MTQMKDPQSMYGYRMVGKNMTTIPVRSLQAFKPNFSLTASEKEREDAEAPGLKDSQSA